MSIAKIEVPKQFSTLNKLGQPLAVFNAKNNLLLQIIFSIVFSIASIGLLFYTAYLGLDLFSRDYYFPIIIKTLLPWLGGFAVTAVIVLLLLWQTFTGRKKAAVVYEDGFAYSDIKGIKIWPWDQIDSVTAKVIRNYTYGIHIGTTHTYTLTHTNGAKLLINDSLSEVESFYNLLQNKSLQYRYQRSADRYNLGQPVQFGPITISKQHGLQVGKKNYPWDDIAEVSIHQGMLSIKKKDGGWFSGAASASGTIPNLHVLLSIIDQVVGIKTGN